MNFPLILYPDTLKEIGISDYNYEASGLMFGRFYELSVKSSSKTIITKPVQPSLKFEFFSKLEDINILGILGLLLIWWIVLPLLIVFSLIELFRYSKDYNIYSKALKKHRALLQSANKYIDYHEFHSLVLNEFKAYLLKADLELKRTISEIRNKKLEEIIKDIIKPIEIAQVSNIQKGISETFFANQLMSYFDFMEIEIITDCCLDYFFPDIVLNTKTGLYIDIEIDEPYVGNTKEIIHYYDPESKYYCDEIRNNFFLESGWIVIRFSEKQIIKSSLSCCYEVALALANILGFDIPQDKVKKRLVPDTFWTRKMGEELVNSNYRNSYFPEKLNQRFLS